MFFIFNLYKCFNSRGDGMCNTVVWRNFTGDCWNCRIIVISEELWKKYKFCACILYCGNHGFCNFCGINIWNSWGSLCVDHRNLWRGSGISGSDFIGNRSGYCWKGRVFIMEKIKMKKHLRIIE